MEGVIADTQSEEKDLHKTKGEQPPPQPQQAADTAQPKPPLPPPRPAEVPTAQPAPAAPTATAVNVPPTPQKKPGKERDVSGAKESDKARRLTEAEIINNYARLLSKKIQANLAYPDDARQAGLVGTTRVSFTVLPSGQIRPDSLRVVTTSGQAKLDASALATIRASLPFDPAPKEMTVAIAIAFGPKS